VLARAGRQAGNRTNALVSLMSQYQSQGQADLAVQIARQLLRKAPQLTFTPYSNEDTQGRQEAIQVLVRTGKLKDMIERAEAQLKSSPKSLQILQTLVDYYRASGDKEKLKAAYAKMVQIKPEDGKLCFQIGQQLSQMGDRAGAVEHY